MGSLTVSVIVPTYHRPVELKRCLEALSRQTRLAEQIVVVGRSDDEESLSVVGAMRDLMPVEHCSVDEPGQVASLNRGIRAATGDVIAITDDDAAPRCRWLEQIVDYFSGDSALAGLGGRDWLWEDGKLIAEPSSSVGRVQWFGRLIGNHHLGHGRARAVDILKGANMSFRKSRIENMSFDRRLLGGGAQVHNDLAFSLALRARGCKLIYDPDVAIDHYAGKRADQDVNHRGGFHAPSLSEAAHNETLILLEFLPPFRRICYLAWATFIGTWQFPGLAQLVRLLLIGRKHVTTPFAFARWRATMRGRWEGWLSYRRYRAEALAGGGNQTGALAKV